MNWDMKIAINYGVTRDNKVVLLDTGGITKRKREPIISWFISTPHGVTAPDYKKEFSLEVVESLWETNLDDIARSTFINPDLEEPLKKIIEKAIRNALHNIETKVPLFLAA